MTMAPSRMNTVTTDFDIIKGFGDKSKTTCKKPHKLYDFGALKYCSSKYSGKFFEGLYKEVLVKFVP